MDPLERHLSLRRLVDVLYDIQDVRIRTANRLRTMPKVTREIYSGPLLAVEGDLTKQIDGMLQTEPIYDKFLRRVKGVGPRISGSIIATTMIRFVRVTKEEFKAADSHSIYETQDTDASQIMNETQLPVASLSPLQLSLAQKTERGDYLVPTLRGIGAFDTVSKYWAWWGLRPGARRRRGEKVNWNPSLKELAWKLGKQFVMQGGFYRRLYDREKARLATARLPVGTCPDYDKCKAELKKRKEPSCVGHVDNMSKRKAVKIFVSHLWERWRMIEGLPVRRPYALDMLGHKAFIEWEPDTE